MYERENLREGETVLCDCNGEGQDRRGGTQVTT